MRRCGRIAATVSAMMLVLVSMSPSLAANARPLTVRQYQRPSSAKDLTFNKTYLIGAKDALIAYNMSTQHKMFCIPGVIPNISFDRANDIVMRWTRRADAAPDLPVARALFYGLVAAYPCPR
jgi:Rap1a immunity proteins